MKLYGESPLRRARSAGYGALSVHVGVLQRFVLLGWYFSAGQDAVEQYQVLMVTLVHVLVARRYTFASST